MEEVTVNEVTMTTFYMEYNGAIVNRYMETDKLAGFKIHDSDVWICGFPRSGTTLTQELTYLVNTLDFEKANTVIQSARILFADLCLPQIPYHGGKQPVWIQISGLQVAPSGGGPCCMYKTSELLAGLGPIEATADPRMVKSHLHYYMLPDDIKAGRGKVVYVARHPGPTSISLHGMLTHFNTIPKTSLQDFVKLFLEDKAYGCPWWRHVLEYWEHRNDDNILFVHYEDIVKDKKTVINNIAKFLGKDLTDTDVEKIIEHTRIDNMRDSKLVNFSFMEEYAKTDKSTRFINTGSLSGWKSILPDELQHRLLEMMKERLGHTDLNFDH